MPAPPDANETTRLTSGKSDADVKSCCESSNLRVLWLFFTLSTLYASAEIIASSTLAHSNALLADGCATLVDSATCAHSRAPLRLVCFHRTPCCSAV